MAKSVIATPAKPSRKWRDFLPAAAIFLLVGLAYLPSLRGEFIWDDDYNIIKSAPLRTLTGLFQIWFQVGATQQYYPLTHTSFWLDYHLWGLHPFAYHVENVLLHALSCVLLWRLLRRLSVPGAWLGAALFALHPVCVESVAWITERKNTLSGVFFVASLLAAVKFWLPETPAPNASPKSLAPFGPMKFYWLAFVFYACALCGKTATVGLPAVILLFVWWKRGQIIRRDAILAAPFFVLGCGISLITIAVEKHLIVVGANLEDWHFSPLVRLLILGRAIWFYLEKIILPYPLMFIYPRWPIEESPLLSYVGLAAAAIGIILLWQKRNGWGRPVLAAAGYFFIMLFPVLGFFNVFFYRYAFVCDHFEYLAAMGALALVGAGITLACDHLAKNQSALKSVVACALLLVCGVLTWRQTAVFRSLETLWTDALAHNPGAWMAEANLGIYYSSLGRFDDADVHYHKATAMRPNDYNAYYDLGLESAVKGNLADAEQQFKKALQLCPGYAMAHYELGNVLSRKADWDDAITEYNQVLQAFPNLVLAHFNLANALAQKRKTDGAIAEYSKTMQLDPDFASAPCNLANIFAANGNLDEAVTNYNAALKIDPNYLPARAGLGRALSAQGNVDGSIEQYQKALQIDPNFVEASVNLGNAWLKKGRYDDAIACYQTALRLSPNNALIHHNLAAALSRIGKNAEAQAELEEEKKLQSGVQTLAPAAH